MQNHGKFDGPIPGENYTSNTKNYPWHRPPETADYVGVVKRAIDVLSTPERTGIILTMLEDGETIKQLVMGNIRVAVSKGQMPIDAAVLAAGPIAKYIDVLAKKAGVKAEMGFKVDEPIWTKARLDAYRGKSSGDPAEPTYSTAPKESDEPAAGGQGGLMSAPETSGADEQEAMLGGSTEGTL